jgi:hypothetical protein
MKIKHKKTTLFGRWLKRHKIPVIIGSAVFVVAAGTITTLLIVSNQRDSSVDTPKIAEKEPEPEPPRYYSNFTGFEIENESFNSLPTYCIQMPNDTYGARPQVGLHDAGVVFEAVAEGGITRLTAIYQNPTTPVIGPIRSLRPYHLDWVSPFDCTVVHAGGSDEALSILRTGSWRHLSESTTFMWRDNSWSAPNNLMTTPILLEDYNSSRGFTSSSPATFLRLLPDDAEEALKDAKANAENEENPIPLITRINISIGTNSAFNPSYTYNSETNTYLRSYANGQQHISHTCLAETERPARRSCQPEQVAPSVVVAMMADQRVAGRYTIITSIGSGTAYIFQNGGAVKGTWQKLSRDSQIEFFDEDGRPFSFVPGQIWISVAPSTRNVTWQ